ncbi:MAG: TetR/AcrR family transcriptional regulator, partial [Halioglobus sp.]|nr:TetR/AcrR family transcriptional regulator [Halioglobus sp.]
MTESATTTPKGRRRRNPEATREDIITAARTVLASDGPDGLSLSKVAHLAGVNRGTAYQHFETREDLIKATVEWVSRHLSENILGGEARSDASIGDNPVAMFDVINGLATFAVENPELGRFWLFEMLSSDNPEDDVFFSHFHKSTAAMTASDVSEPGIDAEVLSVLMLAGYFLWPVWVRSKARTKKERNAMARRMSREVLRLTLHGT